MKEKTHRSFDDWYNEIENFGMRSERLTAPVAELQAAFEAGESSDWESAATEAIRELLVAHEALDRKRLGKALNGLKILVGH